MKDPIGILATTTLWLTLKFLVPKSSVVVETEMEVIAPVQTPMIAVLM
jgi:hypothetical protein